MFVRFSQLFSVVGAFVILTNCGGDGSSDGGDTNLISKLILSDENITVNESMGAVTFSGGKTLSINVGIGSGAFHFASDPVDEFYSVTDRGPNIDCSESNSIIGIKNFCVDNGKVDDDGKIFTHPDFRPAIYKIHFTTSGVAGVTPGYTILSTTTLKNKNGDPLRGLPNPLQTTTTENAYNTNGNKLSFDPDSVDTEAIVKLSDGTFWLSDEYAPSLIHVAANGRILERLVPQGIELDLNQARYNVEGVLPAILRKRALNRGIEALAVSPEEKYLYFIMQNALANPDTAAYKKSRYVRLFKVSLRNGNVDSFVGEYVYVMDKPETFTADKTDRQSDVKISEMVALDADRLVILERVTQHTKLYRVDTLANASNILGTEWDNEKTSPSLENLLDLTTQGITSLSKKLVFDSAKDMPDLPQKIEGLAVLNRDYVVLLNDNDFGITDEKSHIIVKKLFTQLNN